MSSVTSIFFLKWYSSRPHRFTLFQRCCEHKLLRVEFTDFRLKILLVPPFIHVIVIIMVRWPIGSRSFHFTCSVLSMIFLWSHWFLFLSIKIVENTCTLLTWCFSCLCLVFLRREFWLSHSFAVLSLLCLLDSYWWWFLVPSRLQRKVSQISDLLFKVFFFVGYRQQNRYWLLPGGKVVVGGVRTPFFSPTATAMILFYVENCEFFFKAEAFTVRFRFAGYWPLKIGRHNVILNKRYSLILFSFWCLEGAGLRTQAIAVKGERPVAFLSEWSV